MKPVITETGIMYTGKKHANGELSITTVLTKDLI